MPNTQINHKNMTPKSSIGTHVDVMAEAVTKTTPERRDTGFPEPFHNGPNTTLPHPEADLSPNCTLSHDEVSVERALLKRHRLSFLRRNKRGVTSGTLDPQEDAFRHILSLTMMDIDGHGSGSSNFINPSASSLRLSKDGNDSLRSTSKRDDNDNDTPPTSPDGSEHHHKSGIFGKWRRT